MGQILNRSVFHIRLKNFEIQAERMLDASLRTRALAVISSHRHNGTIVALSPEAKEEGLQQGMKISLARKMSHSALLLPYNTTLYDRINRYIYQTLSSFSPAVEPAIYGQFHMEMTRMGNIYRNQMQAGYTISKELQFKINLGSQVGISTNKLVSQISTQVVPEQINEVQEGSEPHFLSPLPSKILPATEEKQVGRIVEFLFLYQVQDIQDVVMHQQAGMILFGQYHKRVAMEAQGQDTSMVKPPQRRNHIIEQKVLANDTNDETILRSAVRTLAEQVAFKLRQRRQVARSVTLEIHYADGFKNARKGRVKFNDDLTVTYVCLDLFTKANYRRNRIRAIFIDATNLKMTANQLNLFDDQKKEDQRLAAALDIIRRRYGFDAIKSVAAMA